VKRITIIISRAAALTARRAPRRAAGLVTVAAAVGVVMALALADQSSSSTSAHGKEASRSATASVQRRDLVETDTESGTLNYAHPETVYDGLSGTITWLPAVGQLIKPGRVLYRVGGEPVILMNGTTPAYRDLDGYDSPGQDVLQLNRNLVALGFDPERIVVDDVWQPATTAGVERLQESLGETETGDIKLGQIVFLPGRQLVSSVDATLGFGGAGGSSGADGGSINAGGAGGSATAILQTSSTELIATVDLDASKQSEATLGERVTVEMPSGSTVHGTVTAVSPVAQSSNNAGNGNGTNSGNGSSSDNNGSGSSTAATIPVTITLAGRHSGAGLDQAAVSVNFAQHEASNVLSVPVTALLAIGGGGYAVQETAAPHRLIRVTTGLFAGGEVQISGADIYPGLQVTDSQG
jgi:hypothetical protein